MATPPTFSEEFDTLPKMSPDGGADGTWQSRWFWGARYLDDQTAGEYFSDASVGYNPYSVAGGALSIKAVPIGQSGAAGAQPWATHASGMLDTDKFFSQQYGYFEVRAQNAPGDGFLSAFWLIPADHSWPPELDIMEVDGGEPGVVLTTAHSGAGGTHTASAGWSNQPDTTAGFHTYGMDWGPEQTVWYFDGKEAYRAPTPPDANKPMHFVMDLGAGTTGSWHGDASDAASSELKVDYVRVWAGDSVAGPPEGAVGGPAAPPPAPGPAPAPAPTPVEGRIINGTERGDRLNGTAGNDGIYANGGDDRISGGPGDDIIYNGHGRDRDIFSRGDGHDVIGDFWSGTDKLELRGFSRGEVSWPGETHDGSAGTMVHAGAGDTVWMPNTSLVSGDVVFA